MHFNQLAIAFAAGIVSSAVIADPKTDNLHRRVVNDCTFQFNSADSTFHIDMDGWGDEPDGCGNGLLDNLRGSCTSDIQDWGCSIPEAGSASADFSIPAFEREPAPGCVETAINLASQGSNVQITCTCTGGDSGCP
ncbi:hypothetical protein BJ170DRAFT_288321 [Xylariales sp. AK1849]|nr:hypothetical protein BJ170DRAFT_288321 [Xylariales sp. AK1849]